MRQQIRFFPQLKLKSGFIPVLLFICTFCLLVSFDAKANMNVNTNLKLPTVASVLREPVLSSNNYLLMDYYSGKVLVEKDIDKIIEPASLTKMMTMYVVDNEIKNGTINLDDEVLVSKKAWKAEGSRMFLEVGSKVPVREIIKGIIISSANDGSIAIAEHIAGTEGAFADIMNFYASKLGMNNTNFVNATGLPSENHYTTARDMAILAAALIRDFPESYALYAEKEHTHLDIKQYNRNRLLWRNSHVDGIKTGHTDSAGFCLVSSAKKDNMRFIAVVMGAKNDDIRTSESNKLLTWGLRFFETHKLYSKDEPFEKLPIWMGVEKNIPVGLNEDLYVTIKKGTYQKLNASIDVNDVIKAPKKKGDAIGTLKVKLEDEVIIEKPLVALQDINSGGIFTKVSDYLTLTVKSLIDKINI